MFDLLCNVFFAIILMGMRQLGSLNLFVFLVSCDCYCYLSLSRGMVGWSAVCDCVFSDHTHLAL